MCATVLGLGLSQAVLGQVVAPPVPVQASGGQPDLNNLVHQVAERVRHLGEDIASDLAQTPQGRHLIEDTRELAQAVDDFHETLHGNPDPARVGQAFAGIEGTWNHLKGQFAQSGISSAAVDRALRRVDDLDSQIRQRLALNTPAPGPARDLNRVTHEMAERVRHLGEDLASDLGRTPRGRHLLEDLRELAVAVDSFHESLHNVRDVGQLRQAYRGIDETWHHLKSQLAQPGISSPAVSRAASHVDQLDARIHQALGIQALPPPQPMAPAVAPQPDAGPGVLVPGAAPASPAPPGAVIEGAAPRDLARAAREFGRAVENLEDAIEDTAGDSLFVGEVKRLADSAKRLSAAVREGAAYEQVLGGFQGIERAYGRITLALKGNHELHHDPQVVRGVNDTQVAFARLQALISGRR
jgi:hypothetical protein